MGKSIIISSKSNDFIANQINEITLKYECFPSDILKISVEPKLSSIGIKKMLELKSWSIKKPFNSKNKIAFIYEAHLLTAEAQNSILKLLEEPSQNTFIVLITNNHNQFLQTIISRCQLIIDNSKDLEPKQLEIEEYFNKSLFEKFEYIEKIEKDPNKKNLIDNFLKLLLNYFRVELLNKNDISQISKIKLINETKKMINAKVSSRNALENLIIQLD